MFFALKITQKGDLKYTFFRIDPNAAFMRFSGVSYTSKI